MTNKELAELVLKAKAFDNLMKLCDGKEECVNAYNSIVERPIPAVVRPEAGSMTMEIARVHIYEWRIRVKNNTDLRQVLLDEAKKAKS